MQSPFSTDAAHIDAPLGIDACVRANLHDYFENLQGETPSNIHTMLITLVERPMLEVVMQHAQHNQCRAAAWLGLNRNTLRKKLLEHGLI